MIRELHSQIQVVENLLKKTDILPKDDLELHANWARYVCVICSGLLENVIKEIYKFHVNSTVSRPVANYVSVKLDEIRNPKATVFIKTAMSFSDTWGDELKIYLEDNGRGDAIDSIILNRHLIVHGRSKDSRITIASLKEYLKKTVDVIRFLEKQVRA